LEIIFKSKSVDNTHKYGIYWQGMLNSIPKYISAVNKSLRPAIASHLAMLVLLLFLCTQIHSVVHHHDDLGDHPDCSVCVVAHHQGADYSSPISFTSPAPIISLITLFFTAVLIVSSAPLTYPSRAPPL
jgi:hypothetical protein